MNSKKPIPEAGLETQIASEKLVIKTGNWAYQAGGAVTVSYGDTVVLATVVMSKAPREGIDFLPLLVNYEERLYAAGKISSSRFIKREGRPSENAILAGRLVDRSFRPLFPFSLRNDVQIILTVLSVDDKNDPDIASIIAASTALLISNIPWQGPVGAVRVGKTDDKFVLNPSYETRAKSKLDLFVSGTTDEICMVEAGANEISEGEMVKAITFAHKHIKKFIDLQKEIAQKVTVEKKEVAEEENKELAEKVKKFLDNKLEKAILNDKLQRDEDVKIIKEELIEKIREETEDSEQSDVIKQIEEIFSDLIKKAVRNQIVREGKRTDGRGLDEIRPLKCDVGVLPRTHGSGLFSRGYTQVLSILTLGSSSAEQTVEGIEPADNKRFMHHYNFPPFSVGEVAPIRSTSRREIGHGALAEKSLLPVIPNKDAFPYTIRLVSEVLSSDGSTSMASVCGSTLALMDAGVPIKKPVAGIAMGLIKEDKTYKILTDIAGIEDACGDMDFKVAGTKNGITALQMDIKVSGISETILKDALNKALKARLIILKKIEEKIPQTRKELSPYAPRITVLKVNPDKVRDIIGPGGKMINKIIDETGVEIDIEPEGVVKVCSTDASGSKKAIEWIEDLTREAKVGEIYQGKVTRIMDFGAFVEIFPGAEGLVHISQLDHKRVEKVEDVVKVGNVIPVMVTEIDSQGRINLSHKVTKEKPRS